VGVGNVNAGRDEALVVRLDSSPLVRAVEQRMIAVFVLRATTVMMVLIQLD